MQGEVKGMNGYAESILATRDNFGLLPEPERRTGSLGASMLINLAAAGVVLLLTLAHVESIEPFHGEITSIEIPAPHPVIPAVPLMKLKKTAAKPVPAPPRPVEIHLPTPSMPKMELPGITRKIVLAPQTRSGAFVSVSAALTASNRPAPSLKAGGFGDPEGVPANPAAHGAVAIAAAGAFGDPYESGSGSGGGRTSRGSGIASAGFGGGLGSADSGGSGSAKPAEPQTTPVVVLEKPLPAYTPEARQLKIEGDVTLQVRFTAAGSVQVLKVVGGLGHGLDDQAWKAAEQIRFHPATRHGQPVDQVCVIHVTFQLA
jgi:TonB family protein